MDLQVVETGNGGDLNRKGNDLALVFSFENMPYLALFGGNKEATTTSRLASEQAFDFWGNALLLPNDTSRQFNSLTERALETTPLTSAGRLLIEEAIKKDLEFMRPFANVSVTTEIIATDHLRIGIGITQPGNLQERRFIYIWEQGALTVLDEQYTENTVIIEDEALQYELNFYL
jgi:hypothetical protein